MIKVLPQQIWIVPCIFHLTASIYGLFTTARRRCCEDRASVADWQTGAGRVRQAVESEVIPGCLFCAGGNMKMLSKGDGDHRFGEGT